MTEEDIARLRSTAIATVREFAPNEAGLAGLYWDDVADKALRHTKQGEIERQQLLGFGLEIDPGMLISQVIVGIVVNIGKDIGKITLEKIASIVREHFERAKIERNDEKITILSKTISDNLDNSG